VEQASPALEALSRSALVTGPLGRVRRDGETLLKWLYRLSQPSACYDPSEQAGNHEDLYRHLTQDPAVRHTRPVGLGAGTSVPRS
jgi:hypothetical protein